MESHEVESSTVPAFRLAACARGKALVGVVAVVATSSFAFLVFGPLAHRRAPTLAGVVESPAIVASSPVAREGYARLVPRELASVR